MHRSAGSIIFLVLLLLLCVSLAAADNNFACSFTAPVAAATCVDPGSNGLASRPWAFEVNLVDSWGVEAVDNPAAVKIATEQCSQLLQRKVLGLRAAHPNMVCEDPLPVCEALRVSCLSSVLPLFALGTAKLEVSSRRLSR
eukprot:gnl/Hemi2/15125_TR5107_c0_g1_i1.p1 gnl/Hemi2/15125_TR5107_c0_g1~~gnl/Hemi2/15125_TR5107_c0_g1_i1.p1  ORF type:complete len:141 (+),score=42.24 gnl/Hemi2/15125_TR5107_c0_g1_i1:88-510(+)